jgi:hypothetical protein
MDHIATNQAGISRQTVYVPRVPEHEGVDGISVTLNWTCPQCGGPRGEVYKTRSYDGSRILHCDGWLNPCGHVDKYSDVVREALRGTQH